MQILLLSHRRTTSLLLLAALVLAFTPDLHAQLADLVPGLRIRFGASADQQRVDGTIIARSGDSIVVANSAGAQYRVTATSLTSLEVYRGRSSGLGAQKGALWGAAVSVPLVLLAVAWESPSRSTSSGDRGGDKAAFAIYGIGVYAGIGAIIGALVKADEWQSMRTR